MSINRTKTEGLALGTLRPRANQAAFAALSRQSAASPDGIQWCPDGSYIKCLGIPIGNDFDTRHYFISKYKDMKAIICRWHT
eukprot:12641195-Prorocentrum_lima.AAC.1